MFEKSNQEAKGNHSEQNICRCFTTTNRKARPAVEEPRECVALVEAATTSEESPSIVVTADQLPALQQVLHVS